MYEYIQFHIGICKTFDLMLMSKLSPFQNVVWKMAAILSRPQCVVLSAPIVPVDIEKRDWCDIFHWSVCIHGDIIQCVWGGNWNNHRKPYDSTEGFELGWIGSSNLMGLFCDMVYLSMMTSSNGSIFCVTGPLCGEFTGHWWIPLTKASFMFPLICALNKRLSKHHKAGDLRHHCAHYDVIGMERGQRA